jgi:hypothetical protein
MHTLFSVPSDQFKQWLDADPSLRKKITQHRSAKSGEFVTKQYAEKHKSTTVTERNNAPKPSPSKSRGK